MAALYAAALLLLAGSARGEVLRFSAVLASEVATVVKPGARGTAVLSADTNSRLVTWTVEYSGLSALPRALGCGAVDAPSPAILVTNSLASPITGSKTVTDAEIAALKTGGWACVLDADDDEDSIGGVLHAAR